jgi:Putative restriction endonuclease
MWQEHVPPLLIIEYVSGDGTEERDATPEQGKFWIYEQRIQGRYYLIFHSVRRLLESYELIDGHYQQMTPNAHDRYPITPLRVELGLWDGTYRGFTVPWVHAWDADKGNLMLTGTERANLAEERAQRYAERLRSLGIDPDA